MASFGPEGSAPLGSLPLSSGPPPLPAQPDPNSTKVVLLLHMDGGAASTTFTDSSPLANAAHARGAAQQSTTNPLYGTSTALFNGVAPTSVYSSNLSGQWVFAASDMTVELAIAANSVTGLQELWNNLDDQSWPTLFHGQRLWLDNDVVKYWAFIPGQTVHANLTSPAGLIKTDGSYQRIAVVRSGINFVMLIDGVVVAGPFGSNSSTETQSQMTFGAYAQNATGVTTNPYSGRIDEAMVTIGDSTYAAALVGGYIPRTSAFPSPPPLVNYNATQTDAGTASETVNGVNNRASSITEAATASTTQTGNASAASRSIVEAATATELSSAASNTLFGAVTETATATSVSSALSNSNLTASITEPSPITDRGFILGIGRVTETASALDTPGGSIAAAASITEAASALDTSTTLAGFFVDRSEAAVANDTSNGVNDNIIRVVESADAQDTYVVVAMNAQALQEEPNEITEFMLTEFGGTSDITEPASAVDASSVVLTLNYFATQTDAAPGLVDIANAVTQRFAAVTETANALDVVSAHPVINRSITEPATATTVQTVGPVSNTRTITEAANATTTQAGPGNQLASVSEAASASTTQITTNAPVAAIVEHATAADSNSVLKASFKSIVEAGSASDISIAQGSALASRNEPATALESNSAIKAGNASVTEPASANSAQSARTDSAASVIEAMALTDAQTALVTAHWVADVVEQGQASETSIATLRYFAAVNERAHAVDHQSINDINGYEPGNPAVWLAEYRRHVWVIRGRR